MVGQRFRIVTIQNEREHVSSVVLSEDEAYEHLAYEMELHEAAGWIVHYTHGVVFANRDDSTRMIFVRSYEPLDDI